MQDFIQKYGIIIIVVVLLGALGIYWMTGGSKSITEGSTALAFFVDENDLTKETVRPASDIPPIVENGMTLVMAVKRTKDGKNAYIAYLAKYTPEAKEALEKLAAQPKEPREGQPPPPERPDMIAAGGKLVRLPKAGSPWIPAMDPRASEIMATPMDPNGNMEITVYPR